MGRTEKSIVLVTAEADWKTKLAATESEMGDRIRSQQLLTDAIGKGYEATKRANAETAVMSFAKEKYDDPIWMSDHAADISKVRAGAGDEFDAKHKEQVATAVDGLTHQIELEKSLAAVQSRGAEAVRLVALAYKLAELARKGNNAEAAKEIELYNSQRANVSAEHIAGITREIDATRRLSAAQIEGAEALRRAELEVKYAQMTHDQVPAQEIAATRLEDELKHQQAVTAEVLKTVNAGRDRLAEIDQEEAAAKALVGSAADQLGIMIKLRELENERLEILARQAIKVGTLQGGLRAFFLDMEKEAEKPGKILLDGMNEAVSGISNNLTKLLTGQKAAWAQMFKSIGNQMLEASIKSGLQTGLGALGKKLGIAPRLDGQSPATAPWVRIAPDATTPKAPGLTGTGGGAPAPNVLRSFGIRDGQTPQTAYFVASSGSSGGGGALAGLAGLFGGGGGGASAGGGSTEAVSESVTYMARGGDVSADKSYIVGDDGPELLRKTRGTVVGNAESRKLLGQGGDHYYTIDARGTDPVLTEQRTRAAIIAAHNSAVGKGFQVQQEHLKRTPQK